MPVKVKFGGKSHSIWWRIFRGLLLIALVFAIIGGIVFAAYYHEYSGMVDQRLAQGPLFESVAQVYAAPQEVRTGQALSAAAIAPFEAVVTITNVREAELLAAGEKIAAEL